MPFNIDVKLERTSMWDFDDTTEAARKLQALIDGEKRKEYETLVRQYQDAGKTFSLTKGKVYETLDTGRMENVSIKFQVKKGVITWYFIAPMDQTKQDYRDRVYQTAAVAHQSVDNGCETYDRGSNHFHLKVMHTTKEESGFNHNHYRTDNGVITPKEVYQHIMAFHHHPTGREIVSLDKAREIVFTYSVYWAENAEDVRYLPYVIFENEKFLEHLTVKLAKIGKFTPSQVDKIFEQFLASDKSGVTNSLQIFQLLAPGTTIDDLSDVVERVKALYRTAYLEANPDYTDDLEDEFEPIPDEIIKANPSDPSKISPREYYLKARDQALDAIDEAEYQFFSPRLIQKCRSIDNHQLGELTPEKFRRALMLYNMLRVVQIEHQVGEDGLESYGKEPIVDPKIFKVDSVMEMIRQLPELQMSSTEDAMGEELILTLATWALNPPKEIAAWIDWVSVNGSRGMGSEIAQVRDPEGKVHMKYFIKMDDRGDDVPQLKDAEFVEAVLTTGTPEKVVDIGDRLEADSLVDQDLLQGIQSKLALYLQDILRSLSASTTIVEVAEHRRDFTVALIKLVAAARAVEKDLPQVKEIAQQVAELATRYPKYDDPITKGYVATGGGLLETLKNEVLESLESTITQLESPRSTAKLDSHVA